MAANNDIAVNSLCLVATTEFINTMVAGKLDYWKQTGVERVSVFDTKAGDLLSNGHMLLHGVALFNDHIPAGITNGWVLSSSTPIELGIGIIRSAFVQGEKEVLATLQSIGMAPSSATKMSELELEHVYDFVSHRLLSIERSGDHRVDLAGTIVDGKMSTTATITYFYEQGVQPPSDLIESCFACAPVISLMRVANPSAYERFKFKFKDINTHCDDKSHHHVQTVRDLMWPDERADLDCIDQFLDLETSFTAKLPAVVPEEEEDEKEKEEEVVSTGAPVCV